MSDKPLTLLISAAEISSDLHGAVLLKRLRERLAGRRVEAFGIGGERLHAEGMELTIESRDLLAMGFVEILTSLPRILRALWRIRHAARARKPDLAILIDYPDFHFLLARALGRQRVPMVYFIPPKVWAWRKGRLKFLQSRFRRLFCIFPFEVPFYRAHGVEARYVGNPLAEVLPLELSRDEARRKLGLSSEQYVIAVLLGSRPAEIRGHAAAALEGALRHLEAHGKRGGHLRVPFPTGSATRPQVLEAIYHWERESAVRRGGIGCTFEISQGDAHTVMRAADVGVIKSGTSTLEAALLGLPHVIVYQAHALSRWIFRWVVRYRGPVGLSNLVAMGLASSTAPPIEELLGPDLTAENVARALHALTPGSPGWARHRETLARVREEVLRHREPGRALAEEVAAVLKELP